MNAPLTPKGLPIAGLEQVYDELATAIDAHGEHSELVLVKLALLMAQHIGDEAVFSDLLKRAQKDL